MAGAVSGATRVGAGAPHAVAANPSQLWHIRKRGVQVRYATSEDEQFGRSPARLRDNFEWMGTLFALNHGVVTTPLGVATSILSMEVANIGNAVLYASTVISSLLLGAPVVSTIGPKGGLLFGMFFYCVYIACFAAAAADQGDSQWLFFTAGSACGGIAAGIIWTAQGSYFSCTATELAASTGQARDEATAGLASTFAFVYLMYELGSKLAFSVLQALRVEVWIISVAFFVVGSAAFALMFRIDEFRPPDANAEPLEKLTAAASLWSDPVTWLLAPINLTFGFCAAYMNGYVNGIFATQEVGMEYVAALGAVTALVAAVLARGYGSLCDGAGKGLVICIGAASFLCIPLCIQLLGCCGGWGWSILVLYVLQGSGRAVYESTNRAVFTDFFVDGQAEGAFANCMVQSSLAFAAGFAMQSTTSSEALGEIVIAMAAITPVGYFAARALQERLDVDTKYVQANCLDKGDFQASEGTSALEVGGSLEMEPK